MERKPTTIEEAQQEIALIESSETTKEKAINWWLDDQFAPPDFFDRVLHRIKPHEPSFVEIHENILKSTPFYDFEQIIYLHRTDRPKGPLKVMEQGEAGVWALCFNTKILGKEYATKMPSGNYLDEKTSKEFMKKIGFPKKETSTDFRTAEAVAKRFQFRKSYDLEMYRKRTILSHVIATTKGNQKFPDRIPGIFCVWILKDLPVAYSVPLIEGTAYDFYEACEKVSKKEVNTAETIVDYLSKIGHRADLGNKNFIVTPEREIKFIDLL